MINPVSKLQLGGRQVRDDRELVSIYKDRIQSYGYSGQMMFYQSDEQHMNKIGQFGTLLHDVVQPEESVLDIGCGYGSLVPLLPPCGFLGIDIVPEFILYARERYKLHQFEVMDVRECPSLFDWSILVGVVNTSPDPEILVNASWERCKKGMIIDFVDSNKAVNQGSEGQENILNLFDIGKCVRHFLDLGAGKVEVLPTSSVWTILFVQKEGRWVKWR